MYCGVHDEVNDLLQRGWYLCLTPLFILNQLSGLINPRLVERLQE
jgi:hypothetical protein